MSENTTSTQTPETTTKAATPRDGQGRFTIGNPGGPGNPFARKVAALRRAMLEAVGAEDIAAIMQTLMIRAKGGDVQAAKLVLAYTVGKPDKAADPDRADIDEWDLHKESAGMMKDLAVVSQAPPAEVPLRAARILRPLVGSIVRDQLADMFLHPEKHQAPELVMDKDYVPPPSANGFSEMLGAGNGVGGPQDRQARRLSPRKQPSTNGKKAHASNSRMAVP